MGGVASRADLEIEALYEVSRVLAFSQDINKAFTSVLNVLAQTLGMENGTVSLLDPVTGEVFLEAAPEMTDAERILGRMRPGEGIIGRVFQTGMPMVVPDIAQEPLFLNRTGSWRNLEHDPRAFLGVPIRDMRVTVGVLSVDRRHAAGELTWDRDVRFLSMVASMVAARVRLSQMHDPLHRADRDDLVPAEGPGEEPLPGVVTVSQRMRVLVEQTERVAQSRATVLLRGESGTGKEVFARAIHQQSPRAARPFVAINCGAIAESLVESELFGHEKGAFTGAHGQHAGRFEQADGGTLFLDEVGELSPSMQVKLLRVLQERQFERIGGRRPVTVDVRLVAATNRDLEAAVRRGTFRLDLYHRLNVVMLVLPPLRDRPEDVEPLARRFLGQLAEEYGRRVELSPSGLAAMRACRWAGNVRQLRNFVERMVVASPRGVIEAEDLAGEDGPGPAAEAEPPWPSGRADGPTAGVELAGVGVGPPPTDEREQIMQALRRGGYVQAKAARLMGMTVRQLSYRIRKYGIPMERL